VKGSRTPTESISIPKALMKEVGSWVGKRGYRSKAELAKESIRLRLEQLRQYDVMLRRLTKK